MAQTIKLKRSAVSGNTPSTSDLELGEIAINTYDGKVFIKKDDGSASVIEVGAADNTKLPLAGGTMTGALNMGGNSIISDTNLTLNVVGSINLDADSNGSIFLKDDGVTYGRLYTSGSPTHFNIKNTINNGDIRLQGKDNSGTEITALTLDMSDAGAAIFNGHGTFNDTVQINSTSTGALTINGSGGGLNLSGGNNRIYFGGQRAMEGVTSNGNIQIGEGFSGNLLLQMHTEVQGNLTLTDNRNLRIGSGPDLQLYHDGTNSYIKNDTGILIIDAANDIRFDAGGGDIRLYDDGVLYGNLNSADGNLNIKNPTADKDISFIGKDGSSTVTALTLDMSEGGSATFANNVTISGNLEVTGTTTQTGSIITNSNFTGLSDANSGNATDFGFYGKYVESSTTKYAGMYYDASVDNTFKLFCDTQTAPTTTVNESATGYALANLNIAGLTTTGNITTTASVGIGTSSPSSFSGDGNNLVVGTTSGNNGISIISATDGTANLYFGDTVTTGGGSRRGQIVYDHTTDSMRFATSVTEHMRIDSSGNVLVSGTEANPAQNNTTDAISLHNVGLLRASTTNAAAPLDLNVKSRDGDIATFRKDGSLIGSIGAAAGRMYIHNNYGSGAGLRFDNASIRPATSTGVGENGTTDLGSTGVRFKDLYLSGSANIGTNILMSNASTSGFMQVSTNILQFGTSSNDPLAIFTNNSEQIRIDTDGRLLLNTTASIDNLSQLHIVGYTSGRAGITLQDGDSTTQKTFFTQSAGTTRFNTQNSNSYGSFVIGGWNGTASADFVRVDSSGAVAIGQATAPQKLTVAGNITVTGTTGIQIATLSRVSDAGRFVLRDSGGNTKVEINGSGNSYFNATSANVGIGTSSPSQKLDVQGTILVNNEIQFINATTRIFRSSNDLRFRTGSSDRMTVTSAGNVGIGTTSPDTLLHVSATSPHIDIGPQGGNRGKIGYHDLDVYIGSTSSTGEIHFKNNIGSTDAPHSSGDTKMVIADSGVGIGTTTPQYLLDIRNPSDSNQIFRVLFPDSSTVQIGTTRMGSGNTQAVFLEGQAGVRFGVSGAEYGRFHTNGFLGIGTTSPARTFHVLSSNYAVARLERTGAGGGVSLEFRNGDGNLWQVSNDGDEAFRLYYAGSAERLELSSSGALRLNDAYTFPTADGSTGQALITDGSGNITFGSVSAGAASSMVDADGDTKIQVEETSDDDVIRFDTAGSQRMIINASGNVGINDNTPAKTLSVNGTFKSTGEAFFSHFDNMTSSSRMRDNLRLNFGTSRTFAILGNSTNMHIRNGSTDVMTFDTNNRVGIGTTSMSYAFEVHGNTTSSHRVRIVNAANGQSSVDLKTSQQETRLIANSGNAFYVYNQSASTQPFTIKSSGRVGIGHTAPNAQLHINAGTDSAVTIGDQTNPALQIGATTNYRFGVYTDNETAYIENKNGDDGLAFRVKTAGEAMRIDGVTGNIGIGTTAPNQGLHLAAKNLYMQSSSILMNQGASYFLNASNGAMKHTFHSGGYAFEGMNVGIGTTTPNYLLDVEGTGSLFRINATSGSTVLQLQVSDTTSINDINFGDTGATARGQIRYRHNGDSLAMSTAGVERLRINSSGNFGIGTTSPSAKLQVEDVGIDTTTTTTSATTQVAIDTMAAATFRSAKYTIQVTNSTDSTYHVTEILLIHDGTTPAITEYGTIFTGSAEATFDADISSGNVRLLATPATTDSMTFKVVRHCITV